ncbi:tetratricopeptide repeat protein [Robiginitalea sp.]
MGAVYAKQGELQKAREAYQKALEIDPAGEEGEEARRRLQEL